MSCDFGAVSGVKSQDNRQPKSQIANRMPDATWRDILLWLLRQRSRCRVSGRSMLPLFKPDDELLVNPHAYRHALPQLGDVVLVLHPHQPALQMVKRVVELNEAEKLCWVQGENFAESVDSRSFGPVSFDDIKGRVECRF